MKKETFEESISKHIYISEDKTLHIVYNWSFWRNAQKTLNSEYQNLLTYNDIEDIEVVWAIWGTITAKVKNHPEVDNIRISIIKDRA